MRELNKTRRKLVFLCRSCCYSSHAQENKGGQLTSIPSWVQNPVPVVDNTPTITLTPTPSETPTITSTPTETSTPTITPIPSETPTQIPTDTPNPNIFFDDFSDGVDPTWNVEYGEDEIINGQLTTEDEYFITTGDDNWTNYIIEVDVVQATSFVVRGNLISVRYTNGDMVAVTFSGLAARIWVSEGGQWRELVHYDAGVNGKTVRVIVQDNLVSAFAGSDKIGEYITDLESGGVGLKIIGGTFIESFKVTRTD